MSSVQGPAETSRDGTTLTELKPDTRPQCPECLCRFSRKHPLQLFCTVAHRDAWNARANVRSRKTFPLEMVARLTRNGTRGREEDRDVGRDASSDLAYLVNRFRDEDVRHGRMPWPQYLRLRYAIGFDPLTERT